VALGRKGRELAEKIKAGTATRGELRDHTKAMKAFLDEHVRKPARGGS
jgi:hypothetical protein